MNVAASDRRARLRKAPVSLMLAQCVGGMNPVRDVSPGGAFIELPKPPAVGDKFPCKLWLSSYETLEMKFTVRRQVPKKGIGVEFEPLTERDTTLLAKYCQNPPDWTM